MSTLGKFQKQPAEVEKYAIQFQQALTPGDNLVNCNVKAFPNKTIQRITSDNLFLTPTEVDEMLVVARADVVLSPSSVVGTRMFVANGNDFNPVTITADGMLIKFDDIDGYGTGVTYTNKETLTYVLYANETAEFVFDGNFWRESFYVRANLVTGVGDQRVRFLVGGGENLSTYFIETTVATEEGRVLQDEFQVKIKEL